MNIHVVKEMLSFNRTPARNHKPNDGGLHSKRNAGVRDVLTD